jgi:aminoglycoside phosphotransferase (APT) family kinase protein
MSERDQGTSGERCGRRQADAMSERDQETQNTDSVRTMAAPDPSRLATALARAFAGPVEVEGLRRLSGGASRETWMFDARAGDGTRHGLVLRRDPGGHTGNVGQSERSTEFGLLQAAAAGRVPVPAVRLLLEPADDLGSGFVMDRVDGETIPRKILRDDEYASARPLLASQCGDIAALVHAVDTASLPALPVLDARAQVEQQRALLDGFGEPHPAFELALQWLDGRVATDATRANTTLVHGDFRNGNVIVGPEGIRAVLDWELAHLGDPIEDLGWLCVKSWRFGVDRVVGGFGDVDELLAAYEARSGRTVAPDHLRFWVVLGTVKWGVICIAQAFTHLNGIVRSVELATLGRRVAEMEWDVLALLEGGW